MEAEWKAEGHVTGAPERRAHPRYPVDEGATLLLLNHGSCIAGRMIDLSVEGCRLRTPAHFSAGVKTRVEIAFRIHGIGFRFGGLVEWTQGGHLVGVRFVEVPARKRVELCDVLLEAEADRAAIVAKEAVKPSRAQSFPESWFRKDERHSQSQAHSENGADPSEDLPQRESAQPAAVLPSMNAGRQAAPDVQTAPVSRLPLSQRGSQQAPRPAGRDRRAQSRLHVDTSADILLINVGSRLSGRIQDLSVGGCRIHTEERFPVGIYTRVETEFRLQGLPFRLSGVIQAVHDQKRQLVGIRFLDMSSRKREQVEQLIQEMEMEREQQSEL